MSIQKTLTARSPPTNSHLHSNDHQRIRSDAGGQQDPLLQQLWVCHDREQGNLNPSKLQAAECAKRDKTAQKKERKERVINYYSESCGESGDESGGDSEDSLDLSGYVSRRTR